MFIPDMPNVPPQDAPVMIAQANQAQANDVTTTRTLGVCYPVPSVRYSMANTLSPIAAANNYFSFSSNERQIYDQQKIASKVATNSATVTVLQLPKHGTLRLVSEADRGIFFDGPFDPAKVAAAAFYAYLPESGFLKESATFLVDFGDGIKVKVVYFFMKSAGKDNYGNDNACIDTGKNWKISATIDANGTNTITSVEYQSPTTSATGTTVVDTAALASTLGSSVLSNLAGETAGVTVNLADLPGAAVGQTVGSTITLDTNILRGQAHNNF